jgi:enamine deaminase RidA (YjgF/YER057c/UK114 family)
MNDLRKINPTSLATPPDGMHAHVVVTPPNARLAFIAGQVALDKAGTVIGPGKLAAQAEQCFRNINEALLAIEALPSQIAQLTIIVVDYRQEMLAEINRAGIAVFGKEWPVTATTLIGAAALGHSAFLIEVNAIVALGN